MAGSSRPLVPIIGDIVMDSSGNAIHIDKNSIHKYSILDVHLPLPGNNIIYPKYVYDRTITL